MHQQTFDYKDLTLEVTYSYEQGEDMIWRDNDGSGYPGSPPSIELEEILVETEDGEFVECGILPHFHQTGELGELETHIIENFHD